MKFVLLVVLSAMFLAGQTAAERDAHSDHERYRDRWPPKERSLIDYEVVRTRFVTRDCEACGRGFGDYGLGVLRCEERIYREHLRGRIIRTWREDEEFFEHCERRERYR